MTYSMKPMKMDQYDFFKELPDYLHSKNNEFMNKFIGTVNINLLAKKNKKEGESDHESESTPKMDSNEMMQFQKMQDYEASKRLKQALMIRNATTIKELAAQLENRIKRVSIECNGIVKDCEFLQKCNEFILDYTKEKKELK